MSGFCLYTSPPKEISAEDLRAFKSEDSYTWNRAFYESLYRINQATGSIGAAVQSTDKTCLRFLGDKNANNKTNTIYTKQNACLPLKLNDGDLNLFRTMEELNRFYQNGKLNDADFLTLDLTFCIPVDDMCCASGKPEESSQPDAGRASAQNPNPGSDATKNALLIYDLIPNGREIKVNKETFPDFYRRVEYEYKRWLTAATAGGVDPNDKSSTLRLLAGEDTHVHSITTASGSTNDHSSNSMNRTDTVYAGGRRRPAPTACIDARDVPFLRKFKQYALDLVGDICNKRICENEIRRLHLDWSLFIPEKNVTIPIRRPEAAQKGGGETKDSTARNKSITSNVESANSSGARPGAVQHSTKDRINTLKELMSYLLAALSVLDEVLEKIERCGLAIVETVEAYMDPETSVPQ